MTLNGAFRSKSFDLGGRGDATIGAKVLRHDDLYIVSKVEWQGRSRIRRRYQMLTIPATDE